MVQYTYYQEHFWRGEFFNKIIKELNYSSYLELGVSTGDFSFKLVECDIKIGVDNNPNISISNVVCKTTDDYFTFLDSDIKFDLIFIDAYHEKTQVFRDFYNSIEHLNENGMIILHDIYPLSEKHSDQSCNGDCYRFWIELVKNYPNKTAVFTGHYNDQEGTVGIYFGNKFDRSKIKDIDYSYSYFNENISKYIFDKELKIDEIILLGKFL